MLTLWSVVEHDGGAVPSTSTSLNIVIVEILRIKEGVVNLR